MSKITAFRLASGHEVIGRIEHQDEQTLVMSKVRTVGVQVMTLSNGQEQGVVGLGPYMLSNLDGKIRFYTNHFEADVEVSSEMEKKYIQDTTVIQLVK